jgi:tRNA(Ile)-lysidine synthase
VLPALRAENPNLDAALLRLAASAQEWLDAIDALAAPFLDRQGDTSVFSIECPALAAQPAGVRKRAIALLLERAGLGYDAAHLDAIDALVVRPPHGQRAIDVPGGRAVRSYDVLHATHGVRPHGAPSLAPPAGPYMLRTWRPGDRMRPARLKGRSRKLADIYGDAKIPRELRAAARVLIRTTDQGIVWAEHVGLAHGESSEVMPKPA